MDAFKAISLSRFSEDEQRLLYDIAEWVELGGVILDLSKREIAKRICVQVDRQDNGIQERYLRTIRGCFAAYRDAHTERMQAVLSLQHHITDVLNEQ